VSVSYATAPAIPDVIGGVVDRLVAVCLIVFDPIDQLLAGNASHQIGMAFLDVLLGLLNHLVLGVSADRAPTLAVDELGHVSLRCVGVRVFGWIV